MVTENESEFNVAVNEIEGNNSSECEKCGKVCKSEGGLTRHSHSKHAKPKTGDVTQTQKLDKDTVDGFVGAIKDLQTFWTKACMAMRQWLL